MRIWHILWRIIMESSDSFFSSIRDKEIAERAVRRVKEGNISFIIAIWIEW